MDPSNRIDFVKSSFNQDKKSYHHTVKYNGHEYKVISGKSSEEINNSSTLKAQIIGMATILDRNASLESLRLTQDNQLQVKHKAHDSFEPGDKKIQLVFQQIVAGGVIPRGVALIKEAKESLLSGADNYLAKAKELREHLLSASKEEMRFLLQEIGDQSYGDLLLEVVLGTDAVMHTQERVDLLSTIKELVSSKKISLLPYRIERYEGLLVESQQKIFQRKIPEQGSLSGSDIRLLEAPLFLKDEIKQISNIREESFIPYKTGAQVKKVISEHGKVVFQQQAAKACGQTCVAMVLYDLGINPDLEPIHGHFTNEDSCMDVLNSHSNFREERTEVSTKNPEDFLRELRSQIELNGSAIAGIGGLEHGRIGGHVIICDEVSSDLKSVRIRDPHHGWEITIDSNALLDACTVKGNFEVILQQIVPKNSSVI